MAEVVNVVVAFAVIFFIFKWVSAPGKDNGGSDESRNAARALGFRPKNITPEMVNTVMAMFPNIPVDNIKYDLLRTGSVETTTNKILERGFLDAPPAGYYTIYPRTPTLTTTPATPSTTAASTSVDKPKPSSLISRYQLESRQDESVVENAGGKAKWEDTAEKREASLKERKEKMILAARQRMLAAQKEKAAGAS